MMRRRGTRVFGERRLIVFTLTCLESQPNMTSLRRILYYDWADRFPLPHS
jgi:hypothetical protein